MGKGGKWGREQGEWARKVGNGEGRKWGRGMG